MGLPCAVGFLLLARPILGFLYDLSGSKMDMAAGLFRMLSLGVLFLTVIQTMTGILQGLGKPYLPVISLGIGVVVKTAASIILISDPELNIYGAAVGTILCYAVAAVINVVFVVRRAKIRLSLMGHILKPAAATAVMGVTAYALYGAIEAYSNTLGVLAAVVAGLIVYMLALVLMKGLAREELAMVPGGEKLGRAMVKAEDME